MATRQPGVFSPAVPQRPLVLSLSSTGRAAEDGHAVFFGQRDGELLPVDEVGGDGVAPAHVSPLIAGGVELEEEMVLAVEEDGAVGIVDPVGRGAEVELRLPLSRRCGGLLGGDSRGGNKRDCEDEGCLKKEWGKRTDLLRIVDWHEWVAHLNENTAGAV